jgi:ATP-grasp in the biosynthetic pathway with Ter operon
MRPRHADAAQGPWVLVTDDVSGQNRAAVAAVRALAEGGFRPAVTTCGGRSVAAASRYCRRRIEVPRAGTPGYADALRREVYGGGYLTALLGSDAALVALDAPGAPLVDKEVLAERAAAAGLRAVPGQVFESLDALRACSAAGSETPPYPWVVKASLKAGGGVLQARRIASPEELPTLGETAGPIIVQPFVEGDLRAVTGVVWDGRLLAVSHQRYDRLWPRGVGVGCAASTVEPDLVLEESLVSLLQGHCGVFQVQLIGPYVLDVNPRVFGSMPLTVAAGANLPVIAADAARGLFGPMVRTRAGVRYRWVEGDLRSLAQGYREGELGIREVARQLRPHRGTAHSIESLRDPGPALVRLATIGRRVAG